MRLKIKSKLFLILSLFHYFTSFSQVTTAPPTLRSIKEASSDLDDNNEPVPMVEAPISNSQEKKSKEKKYLSEPFIFFPSADTIAKPEDIRRNEAQLKNYSTGNFQNKKMPVIKSMKELYFDLENNNKDTIRNYGDGWNEHSLYDKNGNITKLHVIFLDEKTKKDSSYLTTIYLYRGDKLARKEHFWYATGSKTAQENFVYDSNGKKAKEYYIALDENGNAIREPGRGVWSVFKYPNNNEEVEEQYRSSEDAENFYILQNTIYRKLNKFGKKVTEQYVEWPEKKARSTYTFDYDEKGNQTKYISSNGIETVTTYNKQGDPVLEVIKDEDVETTVYEYKYDKNGNWTNCVSQSTTKFKTGKIKKSTPLLRKRIIEYYDN